jgi:hypothetical protein
MIVVVDGLRHAYGDRLQKTEGAVQPGAGKEGIMDEVVGDALYVPAVVEDDQTKRQSQQPRWQAVEKGKGADQEGYMNNGT